MPRERPSSLFLRTLLVIVNRNRSHCLWDLSYWGCDMDFLIWVLAGLLLSLVWTAWSCGRSYFKKGRIRGIDEAVGELLAGIQTQLQEQSLPDEVRKALVGLQAWLDAGQSGQQLKTTCHVHLRTLG